MRKTGLFLLKTLLVVLIFVWLFYRAAQNRSLAELLAQPKNVWFLILGVLFNLAATVLTMIRWQWLVKALGIPLSVGEALKIGFIGFVFNFSPMGILGGDLVKGYLLTRKNADYLSRSAASVIIDRVIGLYAMFLLGFVMIFLTGFIMNPHPVAKFSSVAVISLTICTTVFLLFVMIPESDNSWRRRFCRKIPFVGNLFEKLASAILEYQHNKRIFGFSLLVTFGVHLLFSLSLWSIAMGLFRQAPSFIDHTVLYSVSNIGSMIPLSAGPMEYFLDTLYPLFTVPGNENYPLGFGMIVGIGFRFAALFVAGIGMLYYLMYRSDVHSAIQSMKNGKKESS